MKRLTCSFCNTCVLNFANKFAFFLLIRCSVFKGQTSSNFVFPNPFISNGRTNNVTHFVFDWQPVIFTRLSLARNATLSAARPLRSFSGRSNNVPRSQSERNRKYIENRRTGKKKSRLSAALLNLIGVRATNFSSPLRDNAVRLRLPWAPLR
jgi:hypothetical protein